MDEAAGIEVDQQTQTSITEIKPIERNRNEMIKTRGEIREYVESPLVDACERFWDMGVRTLSSSANFKDIGHQAYIIVDFSSLSGENKQIARESGRLLEDYDGRLAIDIEIPVSETTTAEEIKAKVDKIAERFKKQKATWIPSYTLQDVRKSYGIESEDDKYGVDDFKEEGFYYDPEGKRFYLSKEHFQKASE